MRGILKRSRILAVSATLHFALTIAASAQDRALLGVVTDSRTGEPLAAGQVCVRGNELSDRLRPDGVFVLRVPPEELTLVVSGPGYKTEEVRVLPHQAMVRVELEADALKLERLMVSGRATEVDRRHSANSGALLCAMDLVSALARFLALHRWSYQIPTLSLLSYRVVSDFVR